MDSRTSKEGKDILCGEIEEVMRKIKKDGFDRDKLDILHKLTDTLKNFYKIEMAKEYSDNESSHRRRSNESVSHDGHSFDDEYDHKHSERRRHLVHAHYSYDDGREEMIDKLDDLMRTAPTDRDREAIRKCMNIMRDA